MADSTSTVQLIENRYTSPNFFHLEAMKMAETRKKNFNSPEETRDVDKGKVEVLNLGGAQVMRATFQPGWKWSECVKPIVGTDSCEVSHLVYTISGRMAIRMDDGKEIEIGPGDVASIAAGHDAWIVGQEAYVGIDFQGGGNYAKPQS
jgi:uncharacterized cupin superfamily protein